MPVSKADIDREVAIELPLTVKRVSLVTSLFLEKLMLAIACGERVRLVNFGKFKLTRQGGSTPCHPLFGGSEPVADCPELRFRVYFAKAAAFTEAVRQHQENNHGKVRRRRDSRPGSDGKSSRRRLPNMRE